MKSPLTKPRMPMKINVAAKTACPTLAMRIASSSDRLGFEWREPAGAAIGIRHHPAAGGQGHGDHELAPHGGVVGALRHHRQPDEQRETTHLDGRERGGEPPIETDEH